MTPSSPGTLRGILEHGKPAHPSCHLCVPLATQMGPPIAIQRERLPNGKRQACAKGHFFVVLADKRMSRSR